jgi:hypothetical protein
MMAGTPLAAGVGVQRLFGGGECVEQRKTQSRSTNSIGTARQIEELYQLVVD